MNVDELRASSKLVMDCVRGSTLHNLNLPTSDVDRGGLFRNTTDELLRLWPMQEEAHDTKGDACYYELRKFMRLAKDCNPSIIELFWVPDEMIVTKTPCYDVLRKHARLFITTKARYSYAGYAYAQIKKAKGKNKKTNSRSDRVDEDGLVMLRKLFETGKLKEESIKQLFGSSFWGFMLVKWDIPDNMGHDDRWLMDAMMEHPGIHGMMRPSRLDSCVFIPSAIDGMPGRPEPVYFSLGAGIGAAHLEGCGDWWRLYKGDYQGFYRGGQFVCESIPIEMEVPDYIGLLHFNERDYSTASAAHDSFWEWMAKRNEARWVEQDKGGLGFDRKNLCHTFRLLMEAEHIVNEGRPKVRWDGADRDFLMHIRLASTDFDALIMDVEERVFNIETLFASSGLPWGVDDGVLEDVYLEAKNA